MRILPYTEFDNLIGSLSWEMNERRFNIFFLEDFPDNHDLVTSIRIKML